MKILNILGILLVLGFGSRIFAMDDEGFRCKVSTKETERSLPAGTDLSDNAESTILAAPKIDSKVRAEKLAELEAACDFTWDAKKTLVKDAIEKYGIHPNEILTWNPLGNACKEQDNNFAAYLIEKNRDVNCRGCGGCPLSFVSSLPLAKLMISKGARTEEAIFYLTFSKEPKLALLYNKYGENSAFTDPRILLYVWMAAGIKRGSEECERIVQLAKNLIALGCPLEPRIIPYEDTSITELDRISFLIYGSDGEKLKDARLNEAIDEAIQKRAIAQAQGMPVITRELSNYLCSGPLGLVVAYIGCIIPNDVLDAIEVVDREADQGLAQLLAVDRGDEKSN